MKRLITLFFILLFANCSAQETELAVKNASGDLVGIATKNHFTAQPYNAWFTAYYNSYNLDENTVSKLKGALKNIKIKAFMGTWCADSRRETPHFYKLLDAVNFDYANLEMITVNRGKRTLQNLQDGFNIQRVPTFIFYTHDAKTNKDVEIGRFVEYPRETLEKDILKIVTGKPYKHSYQY